MNRLLTLALAFSLSLSASVLNLSSNYLHGNPGATQADLDGDPTIAACISFNLVTHLPASLTGVLKPITTDAQAAQGLLYLQMLEAPDASVMTTLAFAIWELGYPPTPDHSGSEALAAATLASAVALNGDYSSLNQYLWIFEPDDKSAQSFIGGETPEGQTFALAFLGLALIGLGRIRRALRA